jgi:hypothetical protein
MTTRFYKILETLPVAWKAIAVIVAAAGIVVSGFAATLSILNLPADVGTLKLEVMQLKEADRETRSLLEEISGRIKLSNCLTIREKTGGDWRECIQN